MEGAFYRSLGPLQQPGDHSVLCRSLEFYALSCVPTSIGFLFVTEHGFASQTISRYQDSQHKFAEQAIWIHGCSDSPWVREELARREMQPLLTLIEELGRRGMQPLVSLIEEKLCEVKEKDCHLKAQPGDKEQVLISSHGSHLTSREDCGLVAILQICAKQKDLYKGSRIHVDVLERGVLEKNIYIGTSLVNMYAKCGALTKAQEVFDLIPVRDAVSWNALIAGYAQHGHGIEALNCYEQMQCEGLSPNPITFICILKACGIIGAFEKGKVIHAEIVREGLVEKYYFIGNALVDMYAKCGALAKAQEVFDGLPIQDVVSWSALVSGYAQHGHGEEALNCYERMQRDGPSPDAVTFTCILKACGSLGAADKGKAIHAEILKEGFLKKNLFVGNALVDMYAKCGMLARAHEVFDELPVHDIISWNTLVAGYAQFGKDDAVFDFFNKMISKGIMPNLVTLTVMLHVCSHSGLLDEGQVCFETMNTSYGIIPTLEHYTCIVDLYGRAGHFDKALRVIKKLPSSDYLPVWTALLGACRKWGNVKLGKFAFEHAVQLDEKDAGPYVCMSNIYAAAGMQEEAHKIESMRVKNEAWKKPGDCWV